MASEVVAALWSNQLYAAFAALSIGFLYRVYTYALEMIIANEHQPPKASAAVSTFASKSSRPKLTRSTSLTPSTVIPIITTPASPPSSHTVIELVSLEEAEKSAWDDESDSSDFSDDDSDVSSEPPSPLFERLKHFPLPPRACDGPEPIFVDLASLRAPLRTNFNASQRIQKMISARMSRKRIGPKSDELRRAVLENEGRREARRIDEERWERSRRAWEDERRRGEVVIGAFDV